MNIDQLRKKVRLWDQVHSGDPVAKAKFGLILDQIEYHATRGWRVYRPAEHPDFNSNYMERLAAWIGNVASDDDQKLLLEYALFISFFSHDDMAALYLAAMERIVVGWVAKQAGSTLSVRSLQDFSDRVRKETMSHTWFCPVTDSMDINEFCKINHLQGISHRPQFAALQFEAENPKSPNPLVAANWIQYMANPTTESHRSRPPLKRLVLLEDIVGSSTQCENAITWALRSLGVPVLFVPLVLCPNGSDKLRRLESLFSGKLTVCPVIELQRGDLLGPERNGENGWKISTALEALIDRIVPNIAPLIDPYGYLDTGCSIATFKNTPDNTIPIVHHKPTNGRWAPLFPRVFRD
jgi:hypothetical protein